MEISTFFTYLILFISMYFSFFWLLILFNSERGEKIKMKTFPSVSILVPAYNEEDTISHTIDSLLKLKYKGQYEIVIISDGSTDNTVKVLKKYGKKIKVIDKKKNAGKAAAINSGLEKSKAEFVAVVDADSEVTPKALENAIKHFYSNREESIGAVISKMRPSNESGSLIERIQLVEYLMVGLIRSLTASIDLLHLTPGVLSIYRTKLIKDLGGFDEKNLTEDFEAGVRVRKNGHLIEYSNDSIVFTNTPGDMKTLLKQRVRWSRGFIQTHRKHRDIFFNKKYGLFGMYKFPMNVAGPVLLFLAIGLIGLKIYKELYEFVFKLIYAPDTIEWFSFDKISDYILGIDPKIDFLILFSFIIFIFMLYSLSKFHEYNYLRKDLLRKVWGIIMYVLVFNYIYIYIWCKSIYDESRKKGYNWGTKK